MNIKDIINSDEQIEYTAGASFAPFFMPLGVAVVFAILGVILTTTNHTSNSGFAFGVIAFVAAGGFAIFALTKLELVASTKIYITNKRAILKSGIISSRFSELPLERISGMTIVEPLLGKIFKYGTIIIESSASISGVRAQYINHPYDLKRSLKIEQK